MAGSLFRDDPFDNIIGFKNSLLAQKDRFTRALAGHLLSFALTRELAPADAVALDQITEATVANGYQIQTLLKEVILSEPFLSKTTLEHPSKQP